MVHSIYLDFFNFLDQMKEDDPWPSYERLYLNPHGEFLRAYWKNFNHFDLGQIASRVRQIKRGDYGQLRSLIRGQDPGILVDEAMERCRRVFPWEPEPPVYLFVGFFSVDGVTVEINRSPSIALGLERFRDWKNLPLLVSHEYGHCVQRSLLKKNFPPEERNLLFTVIAEGLSVLFTQLAYPEVPLHRHLFLTPERMRFCEENHEILLELAGSDLSSAKLVPIFFGPGDPHAGLPPRLGYFIAREILRHRLFHQVAEQFIRGFPGLEDLFRKIQASNLLSPGREKE